MPNRLVGAVVAVSFAVTRQMRIYASSRNTLKLIRPVDVNSRKAWKLECEYNNIENIFLLAVFRHMGIRNQWRTFEISFVRIIGTVYSTVAFCRRVDTSSVITLETVRRTSAKKKKKILLTRNSPSSMEVTMISWVTRSDWERTQFVMLQEYSVIVLGSLRYGNISLSFSFCRLWSPYVYLRYTFTQRFRLVRCIRTILDAIAKQSSVDTLISFFTRVLISKRNRNSTNYFGFSTNLSHNARHLLGTVWECLTLRYRMRASILVTNVLP